MGDDHRRRPGQGSAAVRGSVLTPPTGVPVVPGQAPPLRDAIPSAIRASQALAAPCVCGHGPDEHRHWRRGSDCGTCGTGACTAYRPAVGTVRRLLRSVRLIDRRS